jgi:antitoxin component YwqK of YwqJK toxin-antitoxin module
LITENPHLFIQNQHFTRFVKFFLYLNIMGLHYLKLTIMLLLATTSFGQKEKHVILYGKDIPSSGYPPKTKVEEGNTVNDRKEGIWIKYHADGVTPKIKGEYVDNQPSGKYWKYYENGKLKESGNFVKNHNIDSLKRYYEDGTLEYEVLYNENGKESGKVKYYFSNGKLEFEYTAVNGIPVGEAKRYFSNGEIKETIIYDDKGTVVKVEHSHPMLESGSE